MTKKTRLIILLICVLCFLIIAPILVAYSMGFRYDFEKNKIVATGGIYVRTFPSADQITIDSNILKKPGLFANSIFAQSLLPKNHSILINKTGYYDYSKILPVQENQVTKLENILLFKKDILFVPTDDKTQSPFNSKEKFIIKNNNLYYSNVIENNSITASQKLVPVLKNLVAFTLQNNSIIWLGTDGFLYRFNQNSLPLKTADIPEKLNPAALKIDKTGNYKIKIRGNNIFLNANGSLLFLEKNNFSNIADKISDFEISPDSHNLAFAKKNNIFLYTISTDASREYLTLKNSALLYQANAPIKNIIWLNNNYIIFLDEEKIIISEIDFRGNINTITLPQTASSIFFNNQDNRLYILKNDSLLVSEKITP